MTSELGLDEINHLPQGEQLAQLMWAHRLLKREVGQLREHKLRWVEQGNLDVWQYQHGHLATSLAEVEQALERICPLPELADLS